MILFLVKCKNQALGGTALATIRNTFDNYLATSGTPSCVILEGGTNNFANAETDPNSVARDNMSHMIDTALANNVNPIVLTIPPYKGFGVNVNGNGWSEANQQWMESYNAWLKSYAADRNVPVVDSYELLRAPGEEYIDQLWDSGDHVHPNSAGRTFLATNTIPYFFRQKINILNANQTGGVYNDEGIELGTDGITINNLSIYNSKKFLTGIIATSSANLNNSIVYSPLGSSISIAGSKIVDGQNNIFSSASASGSASAGSAGSDCSSTLV